LRTPPHSLFLNFVLLVPPPWLGAVFGFFRPPAFCTLLRHFLPVPVPVGWGKFQCALFCRRWARQQFFCKIKFIFGLVRIALILRGPFFPVPLSLNPPQVELKVSRKFWDPSTLFLLSNFGRAFPFFLLFVFPDEPHFFYDWLEPGTRPMVPSPAERSARVIPPGLLMCVSLELRSMAWFLVGPPPQPMVTSLFFFGFPGKFVCP